MKKIFIAALAVCAVFASCSKDDNGGQSGEGKKAVLNITLENPTHSRAAGTAPTGDNTVNEFSVFIINDVGNIGWKTHVSGASLTNFTVSTKATEIYVIANGGDQTTQSYATKAQLLAAVEDLGSMYASRWATGSNTINWGGGTTANVAVTMQFIAARITVKIDNQMTGYNGTSGIIINDVAVLNARGQSMLFGTSLVPASYAVNKTYMMGFADPSPALPGYPAAGTFTVDATNLSNTYTSVTTPATSDYYYYVYETPAANDPATIVTLVGTDANGTVTYWPVHLSTVEDWKSGTMTNNIQRGKSYDIIITLTGDATTGNGGGTVDPFLPVVTSTLDVTLTITDWDPVDLIKEF